MDMRGLREGEGKAHDFEMMHNNSVINPWIDVRRWFGRLAVLMLVLLAGCVTARLKGNLVSADDETRKDAVARIRTIQNAALYRSTVMKTFAKYNASENQMDRVRIVRSIGELGPRAGETGVVTKLEGLLNDRDPMVRAEAGKAIDLITRPVPAATGSPRPARAPGEKRETIAVSDISAQGVSQSDATIVADWLRGALVDAGAYTVVERNAMQKVLEEQAFQQTGCTSQECAVKVGRLLNVQKIVVGSFGKFLDSYVLNVRVVDVESGTIVYSDTAKGKTTDEVEGNISSLASRLSGKADTGNQVAPAQPVKEVQPRIKEGW
jgi:hypothetical protein